MQAQPAFLNGALPEWAKGSDSDSDSGFGYGYGYGYGNGDGNGYGYGYGDGYGYGYGYGYGDGYGDGYGYGSGDGYGSKEDWRSAITYFAKKLTSAERARLDALVASGAKLAFWRSDDKGLPANGGGEIEPAASGVVHTAPGPLNLCHKGTLHATLLPPKWRGNRWWIVAMIGDVIGDEEKYGCLKREIIGEAL